MNRLMCFVSFAALLLAFFSGCGNQHINELTKPVWMPETVTIPELDAVMSYRDPAKPAQQQMSQMEFKRRFEDMEIEVRQTHDAAAMDLKSLAAFIKDSGFQSRLQALENATFPSSYATPQRDESRKNYIQEWKNLQKTLSSGGKPADIKKSIDRLMVYFNQMRYVAGQTPPTGNAAKKYSAVHAYDDPYKQ